MCLLHFVLEHFFKLLQLGADHIVAIRGRTIVVVVILVIVFGNIKFRSRRDLCNDGFVPGATFPQFGFVFFRFGLLFGIVVKDGAAVLGPYIIALTVEGSGVMGLPECFQQFIKTDLLGIVYNLYTFGMASSAFANFFISWIFT